MAHSEEWLNDLPSILENHNSRNNSSATLEMLADFFCAARLSLALASCEIDSAIVTRVVPFGRPDPGRGPPLFSVFFFINSQALMSQLSRKPRKIGKRGASFAPLG